MITEMPCY